jgi:hypothetical protein
MNIANEAIIPPSIIGCVIKLKMSLVIAADDFALADAEEKKKNVAIVTDKYFIHLTLFVYDLTCCLQHNCNKFS